MSTPIPMPTASPTPTPTASATVAPTVYISGYDMSREQFQESPVAESRVVEVYDDTDADPNFYRLDSSGTSLLDQPAAATMTWNPADRMATLRLNGTLTTYSATNMTNQLANAIRYYVSTPDSENLLLWSGTESVAVALGVVSQEDRGCSGGDGPVRCTSIKRYALAGPVANASDVPVSGTVVYDARAFSSALSYRGQGGITDIKLVIDFSVGTVSSNWTFAGRAFELNGTFSRSANLRLVGTVRTADGEFAGRFVGNLYGSKDVGMVFTLTSSTFGASGHIVGKTR